MKGRLFTRVFDRHTLTCYLTAIALMLFLVGGHRSPLLFFLGVGHSENYGMEFMCPSARLGKPSFPDARAWNTKHLYRLTFQEHTQLVADAAGCCGHNKLCIFSLCTDHTVPDSWLGFVVGKMVYSSGAVPTAHHTSLSSLCWWYDSVCKSGSNHSLSFSRVWSVSCWNGLSTSQLISPTLLGYGTGNGQQFRSCGGNQLVSVDSAEPWHRVLAGPA